MAGNHNECANHHHGRALAFVVDKRAKERRENHCQNGEPLEESCGFGVGDLERLFEEVGSKPLEGEDGRVVEYAEDSDNPEHLGLEDLSEVGYMEFFLRVVFGSHLACSNELLVELSVHDGEDKEIDKSDDQQECGEEQGCHYGVRAIGCESVANHRGEEHGGKDTDTGNGHLQSHSERHLLAFEPLGENLADRGACHLAPATENHKTEHSHLSRAGHVGPP